MDIKQIKKELELSNKEIAEFFGMNLSSYANSTAKKRYENAMCKLYQRTKLIKGFE